jgi:predicted enzyme related to lactoylglutathione lyase
MAAPIAHVAINADDPSASMAFYQALFDWRFAEYYPGFYRMAAQGRGSPIVAVQQRRDLLPGGPTTGFECTVAVLDVRAVMAAARAHGGQVLSDPQVIPQVGELVWLADPGGNVVGAMRYDAAPAGS